MGGNTNNTMNGNPLMDMLMQNGNGQNGQNNMGGMNPLLSMLMGNMGIWE